jgi:hypothetical protein
VDLLHADTIDRFWEIHTTELSLTEDYNPNTPARAQEDTVMPRVRGRFPTGPQGVLEVSDEVVRVKRETGFLSKTLKTYKELPVSEAVSTELERSHPRNRKIQRLTIRFLVDDGEEEIVFLSEDGPLCRS